MPMSGLPSPSKSAAAMLVLAAPELVSPKLVAKEVAPRLPGVLVLLLASIDGHSLEEVAELLQVPVGTVKSRLHSARKRLAEKLR